MERRSSRVSSSQWDIMLEFLERNQSFARGYNNSSRGREQCQRLWRQLADLLNAEGLGARKEPKEWATYFNNYKSKLKKLLAEINRRSTGTGGGPALEESLSEQESREVAILGPRFGEGNAGVRVNPFPNMAPLDEDPLIIPKADAAEAVEGLEFIHEVVLPGVPEQNINVEHRGAIERSESPLLSRASPAPAGEPSLERRTRRTRYRTRPLASLDEAQRILSQVEMQRAAADAAAARAFEHIASSLGAIATSLGHIATNLRCPCHGQRNHGDAPDGV